MVSFRSTLLALAGAVAVSADLWIDPESVSMAERSKFGTFDHLVAEPELTWRHSGLVPRPGEQLSHHLPPDHDGPTGHQHLQSRTSSYGLTLFRRTPRPLTKPLGGPDLRLRLQ